MMGVNLHAVVRPVVDALHPDTGGTLYRSTGQIITPDGAVKAVYAEGVAVKVQSQSESPTVLYHADRVGQEENSRKMYLFSDYGLETRVAGIVRELARNGDMLQLENGGWWLVTGIIEDFTRSGWCSVRATLQVNPPDFSHSEWWTE